ncbi:MAG: hypothetical protein GC171_12530 [Terrimonas sp.]|nr:hypothetical protein [Terrimonas sp.]
MKKERQIKGTVQFRETQQFRKPWIGLLLLSPVLVIAGALIFFGYQVKELKPEEMVILAFIIPLNILFLYFVFIVRFETIVTDEAIYFRWWPVMKKYAWIGKQDMARVYERRSPFLRVGYKRFSFGYGRVHHAGSPRGLQFVLKSGRKIFISSGKLKGFTRAVEQLVPVSKK